MNTSLQLPSDLQKFDTPTLFVVADHERAHFWLLSGEHVDLIHQIHEPRVRKSDSEGGFQSTSGQSVTSTDHSEDERLRHYVASISSFITSSLREKKTETFSLIMPADVSHPVLDHLGVPIRSALGKKLDMDLMKEDILEVVKRVGDRV